MPSDKNRKEPTRLTMKHTKQQIFAAYQALIQPTPPSHGMSTPKSELTEKKEAQAIATLEGLSANGIIRKSNELKVEMGTLLTRLTNRMASEITTFEQVQLAIEVKQRELKELYEIDHTLESFTTFIETLKQKRQHLDAEINVTRQQWDKEKKEQDERSKHSLAQQAREHQRLEEEYRHAFALRQQKERHRFEAEMAALLADKETLEKQLQQREEQIATKEQLFASIESQVNEFPKELEAAIANAVKENTERMQLDASKDKTLLRKEFNIEKKALLAKIKSLEKTIKDQSHQITSLSEQQTAAFETIQTLAAQGRQEAP